jgi:hypothetical protein
MGCDVYRTEGQLVLTVAAALVVVLAGCSDSEKSAKKTGPTTRPAATQAAQPEPEPNPIVAESAEWSRDEAVANLEDEALGLSAAVRLVRLAKVSSPIVPDPISAQAARELKLLPLGERSYALGRADPTRPNVLRSPMLITPEGDITTPPVSEGEIELHISPSPNSFPHVLLLGPEVRIAQDMTETALMLNSPIGMSFELRDNDGYPYIVLMTPASDDRPPQEAARYSWDPFEEMFAGPLSDKLPDPPGGNFELDLDESKRLTPRGGEIADPIPLKTGKPGEPQ